MTEELKPCPFCGASAEMNKGTYDFKPYWVCCENGHGLGKRGDSPEEAAEAWNRRAVDVDALKGIAEELENTYYVVDSDAAQGHFDYGEEYAERIRKAVGL